MADDQRIMDLRGRDSSTLSPEEKKEIEVADKAIADKAQGTSKSNPNIRRGAAPNVKGGEAKMDEESKDESDKEE